VSDQSAFFEAIQKGDAQAVEALLGHDPALLQARSPDGVPAALWAIYNNKLAVAADLIQYGAFVDIFVAAAAGRLEQVRAFLDGDPGSANAVASDGFQPLGLACFFGHLPKTGRACSRSTQRSPGGISRSPKSCWRAAPR
jgi:hypothetical protein